ncbi:MAG: hypothetical protein RJB17_1921, partial [Pseudomonadota bacterium]
GLAVDLDFFKIERLGFEQHLGGLALWACGLGVNDDFELHGHDFSDPSGLQSADSRQKD